MLTKNMKISQVVLNPIADWPTAYRLAVGEFLIACSQWEYIYELLWKDLNPSKLSFADRLQDADRQIRGVTKLIRSLNADTSEECIKIKRLVDTLESDYRDVRGIIVHGFHRIHDGCHLVSRFSTGKDNIIGQDLVAENLSAQAQSINNAINEINLLRRQRFYSDS